MVGYGGDQRSMMTMGCEYRARTGACGCPNPPYGCRTGGDGFKISFPKGVNSYRDLRLGSTGGGGSTDARTNAGTTSETIYNEHGIPTGFSREAKKGPAGPAKPPPPPPPLPVEFTLAGSAKKLPAAGWQCTAADAEAAVAAGVRYVDAGGNAAAETALGKALQALTPEARSALTVGTAVSAGGIEAAAKAAAARLGVSKIDLVCLEWSTEASIEAAWGEVSALVDSGLAAAVGLRCADVAVAKAAFEQVCRLPVKAAVLQTPMHPMVPKLCRFLLGLCRRNRCQMVCLDPMGGPHAAALAAHPEVTCAEDAAEVLLAYNVGRGAAVLAAAADGGAAPAVVMRPLRPMLAAHRLAMDKLAPQE